MELKKFKKIHFIGIGGIGMSAIAHYFLSNNYNISGYDKVKSEITLKLESKGAEIFYLDDPSLILENYKVDLVIYTPAIENSNLQYQYFHKKRIPLLKRAEILGEITSLYNTIAVAGTHGKTTTSSIIAHILRENKKDGVSFIGGLTLNYNSNYLKGNGDFSVVEADEYDHSFMKLKPDTIVLTSVDADHLDIYKSKESLIYSFKEFTSLIAQQDKLIVEESIDELFINNLSYGFGENNDLQILNLQVKDEKFQFDFKYKSEIHSNFQFRMPGKYNLLNAGGAILACLINGINIENIKKSLQSYLGVKRRFDIHVNLPKFKYIDDYAHHPTEIKALLEAAQSFYPEKQIIAVFQPHLFSRTKDFMDDFAAVLSKFNKIFLLPIYPARETPIEGISSSTLIKKIANRNKKLINSPQDLFSNIDLKSDSVLITIGAGDIDKWVVEINKYISLNV